MARSFETHARTVSLLTLLSRLTGLARDAVLSRVFGAGGLMDAFFFAFMIPNLFRRLFGEGALSAAFLPLYTQLDRDRPEDARKVATLTLGLLVVGLGAIVVVGEIALGTILASTGGDHLAVRLMMITLPYMPLVCLVAILGAMLQVHGRFGPTAAAPIVLNVAIIAAAFVSGASLGGATPAHIALVAASVIVAGVVQVAWSLVALRRVRWLTMQVRGSGREVRTMLGRALPMLVGLGVLQLNTLLDGLIASYPVAVGSTIFGVEYPLQEGAMATISFAQRLYQFPLGVFGIAVATAIFPQLARLANDRDAFTQTVRRGLRLVVFIGLPASVGLVLVAHPLAAVALQGGRFSFDDTSRVAFVLLGYAPAIWAYSMTHVMTRAFYALDDMRTPVRIAVGVVVLNLVLNVTLIWTPLREAGLAWSTALCAIVQVALLVFAMRRRIGRVITRSVVASWARSVVVAVAMGAAVAGTTLVLPASTTWSAWVIRLIALVAVGVIATVAAAGAQRMPELRWAIGRSTS